MQQQQFLQANITRALAFSDYKWNDKQFTDYELVFVGDFKYLEAVLSLPDIRLMYQSIMAFIQQEYRVIQIKSALIKFDYFGEKGFIAKDFQKLQNWAASIAVFHKKLELLPENKMMQNLKIFEELVLVCGLICKK